MIGKNNLGLVSWAKKQLGNGYVFGTFFSAAITEKIIQDKAAQYPNQYTSDYIRRSRKWLGKVAGDCVGLIKGYYWLDEDSNQVYYLYKNLPDVSADGMLANAKKMNGQTAAYNENKTWGKLSTIPDIPGVLVWRSGHIGVYIGNGKVIESRGVDYGVVETNLNERGWVNWCLCPYIEYVDSLIPISPLEGKEVNMKRGFKGFQVYCYQSILKKLGADVGAFNDLYAKDPNGVSFKTGCDGDFGSRTVSATNELQRRLGEPVTADGEVTDRFIGKLNIMLQEQAGKAPTELIRKVDELQKKIDAAKASLA